MSPGHSSGVYDPYKLNLNDFRDLLSTFFFYLNKYHFYSNIGQFD